MIFSFIKIRVRGIWKNRSFSLVSLGGLSIGMACVVVIFLLLQTEYSFDKFHKNADRVFRVTTSVKSATTGEMRHYATSSPAVAKSLVNEYPQIEEAVRFRRSDNHIITYNNKRFAENNILYVDSGFFRVFSFPLKKGIEANALRSPNSVVLSESIAKKYFGDEDPVGKIIKSDSINWQVTGVLEPVPVNSHIQPDFLVSFDTWKIPVGYPVTLESWTWVTFPTYILVKENTDIRHIQATLQQFVKKYGGQEVASRRNLLLQPLTDIYFANDLLENATFKTGNEKQSRILMVVAILILVIGAFNFMTLFTAVVVKRTKELGIRKVLGAGRNKLIIQLMSEAITFCLICVPFALLLSALSVDWLSQMIGFHIPFSVNQFPFAITVSIAMAFVIGLLAGIYPALQMTAFNPVVNLRNLLRIPTGVSFKKALVITQFTISGILITASVVMYKQSVYISNKELGFASSDLIRIEMPGEQLQYRYEYIKNELLKEPAVRSVSRGGNLFRESIGAVPIYPNATTNRDLAVQMNIQGVHYDFFETFGIELTKGRFINKNFPSDSTDAIVVNEAAVKALGWKDDAIGKRLQVGEIKAGTIVGIVKDFHFRSLHNDIGPLVMYVPPTRIDNIFIKTEPGTINNAAKTFADAWHRIAGDVPLNISFVDDNIEQLYSKDQKFLRLIFLFCGLSMFVACIGLYALTVLITHQRIKEIGIRKVLGASTGNIAALVSGDFAKLVSLAIVIAFPIAWFFSNKWLNEFAYRINITWWLFALAAMMVLLVALLTVSLQAIKAAVANPVKSLRTEN